MNKGKSFGASGLLSLSDPPAVNLINENGSSHAVLLCDHASNKIPSKLGNLGLTPSQLADHISWDPGAAEVARLLSTKLDAPLVMSGYSRLVIDCNRLPLSIESIPEQSSTVPILHNQGITANEKNIRVKTLFEPYHQAINQLLDKRTSQPTVLLSIHSFTPVLNNKKRPWHIGISYGSDRRLAEHMLKALSFSRNIIIGNNQPYPIENHIDYTIPIHGERRGIPHIMIELRQDGIKTVPGIEAWAETLAEAYFQIETEALDLF